MAKWDKDYLLLCKDILENGVKTGNRTGTDCYKLTHKVLNFDLQDEFPILTTKHVAYKSAILEMLWIYQVQSNDVRWLQDRNVKIWDQWQIVENGMYQGKNFGKEYAHTIGTAYGYIVNHYKLIDDLIDKLKNNPDDRRMNMSLWQNEYLKTASLPSCVWDTQWDVTDGQLNCLVNQRSCDVALGLPFNVTQYAVLVHMLAKSADLKPGKMTWVINNAHIYENQIEGIKEHLTRVDSAYEAPELWLNPAIDNFYDYDNSKELKDIKVLNYKYRDKIKMPVSI